MEIIKVSARSRSTAVAGAIAGVTRESQYAEVQAIGASAVNQAIKAIAIARGYLQEDNIDIVCIPIFVEVDIQGLERTAVRLTVWTVEKNLLPERLLAFDATQEKVVRARVTGP
ncbi:MAG: stage V sporulation protein S [Chloroflexi bacterium]|nr:stage V sporulation protein S [Chloroflexota bacterium]